MGISRRDLDALQRAINELPGFVDRCVSMARQVERAREVGEAYYRQSHGGLRGAEPSRVVAPRSVANAGPGATLVELGRLAQVVYLTKKGGDAEPTLYEHSFEGRPLQWPILCFAADNSGLVIVRDRSRYTVTPHGIEG